MGLKAEKRSQQSRMARSSPDSPLYRASQMVTRDVENNEPLKSTQRRKPLP